MWAL